jgi:dihydropteroate synthase
MTSHALHRRLNTMETKAAATMGKAHRFIVPEGLTKAEREAWKAEQVAHLQPNDIAIFRIIVDPGALPEVE